MEEVVLENVDKAYGKVKALDRVSIKVMRGELFTILGPSGCGKTTTLRVIAGFEIPDSGRVYIDGVDVTFKKPYERSTAMVFQNYALWPHMSVFDNIAYGLKLRGYSEAEIKKRVGWVLELLDLKGLEKRYPLQLSGGQQQRVALARALVVEPKVLLLDEPLSNLDARLRLRVREEIVALQKKLGITTVYVTHDQEEAMSISDRIAVMDKGRVVQVGTPWEVYNKPVNYFVATFMGRSNTLNGIVSERVSEELYEVDVKGIKLYGIAPGGESLDRGLNVAVVIRPESLRRAEEDDKVNIIEGSVRRVSLLGYTLQVRVDLSNGASVTAYLPSKESVEAGERIRLHVSPEEVKLYPAREVEDEIQA